jgi:acylaminoacyl-peptidase
VVATDGSDHRALTSGNRNDAHPRWSPDGRRVLYTSVDEEAGVQLYLRWMDTGETAKLTNLLHPPTAIAWSPDGRAIAFTMFVPEKPQPLVAMPDKPEGATWAEPPRVIRRLVYRADGEGYLRDGNTHVFTLPAEGGTPRQLTSGAFDHAGPPAWTPDGHHVLISANRRQDWEHEPLDAEIFAVSVADATLRQLTDRRGPDRSPAVSPDGRLVAYIGFDDRYQGYQTTRLSVMNRDGSGGRVITAQLDRDVEQPTWSVDGKGLYFSTADKGNGKIAFVSLDGRVDYIASDLGGGDLGRPYSGGSYSASRDGRVAYTHTRPDQPPDVAAARHGAAGVTRLTKLNDDVFEGKTLARVEEIWFKSSKDGRPIQGWIAKPPGFNSSNTYPLILEIHGGPFADYGDRFGAEIQLYAAAGYVVLYVNPRGSTSYGEAFGNLIHHAYPGDDYDDLMSGVDAAIATRYVDPDNLFVTGGSGGGVLTAWIVGKTDRFRAAVSAKPVINWHSFVLTADMSPFFYRYWFSAPLWERPEEYLRRSPLALVGNVKTPTMLMTGEQDYRTPMSESEQFYQALKLRRVDTALVRVPDAPHEMIVRPSQLIAKVTHILAWFEKYRKR